MKEKKMERCSQEIYHKEPELVWWIRNGNKASTASFKHEAMGAIFCYEYYNYHTSCQIFPPLFIISLFLQRSNGWIYHCWWYRQYELICSFKWRAWNGGRCSAYILTSSPLGWQWGCFYNQSPLKFRSPLVLYIFHSPNFIPENCWPPFHCFFLTS